MTDIDNTIQACPICGNPGFEPFKLGLLQCDQCKVIVSPAIWQPDSNEQLEDEWFGDNYKTKISFWQKTFEKWNNRRTLSRLAQAGASGNRLLEIGAGSGSFLDKAREQGFNVMGCDLSGTICSRVQDSYGIPMYWGPLESLAGEDRFDVIIMNHVLEHVQQPVQFLGDVKRLLSPGGVIHIAVPNVECWEAAFSGWTSFEPYHLTYFSPQTLQQTISAGGLSIDHCDTHESFSGWFLALLRTALGINRKNKMISRTASSSSGRLARNQRSIMIENIYRLAMVLWGGGELAVAAASGKAQSRRRDYLHCPQSQTFFSPKMGRVNRND